MPWEKTIVLKNIPDEFSDKDIKLAIAQGMTILAIQKNYMGIKDLIKKNALKG